MTKTYLITAATGIGAETAKEILRMAGGKEECNVFLSSLAPEPYSELAGELRQLGGQVGGSIGDLTDPAYAAAMVAACVTQFGGIDALFSVAGISGRRYGDGPVHVCTEEGWRVTLDTNLTTQYRVCREAIRVMREQPERNGQRGAVLTMSSILALHPEPQHFDTAAYAASKGAIAALSRTMAASYAKEKIRVNTVAPALVRTSMSAGASSNPEVLDYISRKQPLTGGVIPVSDVARVCTFLLSEASHAVTGQCIEVDAGWSLS